MLSASRRPSTATAGAGARLGALALELLRGAVARFGLDHGRLRGREIDLAALAFERLAGAVARRQRLGLVELRRACSALSASTVTRCGWTSSTPPVT